MRRVPVTVFRTHQSRQLPPTRTRYFAYSPDRGWRWLQRACIWVLDKIGARHYEPGEPTYERTIIDLAPLAEQIQEHLHDVILRTGQDPEYLLVGYEQYRKLMSVPVYFEAPVRVDNPVRRFSGVPIVLVPWMDGVVAMPRPR